MKPKNSMDSNKLIEPFIYRKYVPMSPPDAKRVLFASAPTQYAVYCDFPPPRWYIDALSIQLICSSEMMAKNMTRMQPNAI